MATVKIHRPRARCLALLLLSLLPGLGAGADAVFDRAAGYHCGDSRRDLARIEDQVRAALGRPAATRELEQQLLALLENEQATTEAKRFAGRQLRLIGGEAAVPALMAWLEDPDLSAAARSALEVIPGRLATKALTNALPRLKKELRVGALNTLGRRRDPLAFPALQAALADDDPALVEAAAVALSRLESAPALAALRRLAATFEPALAPTNTPPQKLAPAVARALDRQVVTEALLRATDRLMRAGDPDQAAALYRAVYVSTAVPPYCRVAALRGLVEVNPEGALPVVLGLVDSGDPELRGVGLSLLRALSPVGLLQLLARLPRLTPETQAMLIPVLAERHDAPLAPTFLDLSRSEHPAVRRAAVRALSRVPVGQEAVRWLAELAATADPLTADAARESLSKLRGPGVDAAVLDGVATAVPALRPALIEAAVARRMRDAVPALLETAATADKALRVVALDALGALADPGQFPLLVEFLRAAETPVEREAALRAVQAVARRVGPDQRADASRALAAAYARSPVPVKSAVLTASPAIGGPAALELVTWAANQEPQKALRKQAADALARWPDTEALQSLLSLATLSRDAAIRATALRGVVRVVALPSRRPVTRSIHFLQLALPLAQTAAERRVVLEGLGQWPHPRALETLAPFLADPEVRATAARAMARVARYLGGTAPQAARAALDRIEKIFPEGDVRLAAQTARARMDDWDGAVEVWRLAGPWPATTAPLETPLPAGQAPDKAAWRLVKAEQGLVRVPPLDGTVAQVALLRVVLAVEKPVAAVLRVRHSGPVKLWLDGQPLDAAPTLAQSPPGGDRLPVKLPLKLDAGAHSLLLKTVRPDHDEWRVGLRLADARGKLLPGVRLQLEP